jgi:hypothetical protein
MNALPPENRTVEEMQVGDIAYTTPWSVWEDGDHLLWIEEGGPAEDHAFGTADLRIRREELGFSAWPSVDHRRFFVATGKASPSFPVAELLEETDRDH